MVQGGPGVRRADLRVSVRTFAAGVFTTTARGLECLEEDGGVNAKLGAVTIRSWHHEARAIPCEARPG